MAPIDPFDEYSMFVESTQGLTEKRQSANETYLSVNTAVFAAFTFIIQNSGVQDWRLCLFSLPLLAAGVFVSVLWSQIVARYARLISWRFQQLMEMERRLEGCHQMFNKEYEKFYDRTTGERAFGFAIREAWLPRVFISLYVVIGVGLFFAAGSAAPPVAG